LPWADSGGKKTVANSYSFKRQKPIMPVKLTERKIFKECG
jgi:hypothetical protein